MIRIDEIKTKKNDILKEAFFDYERMKEEDRKAAAEEVMPGQKMGFAQYNGFYSIENREKAENVLYSHKEKIKELLAQVNNELKDQASIPPTTEQTNLLTVLSIGKPTQEELQTILDANKNNYAMFNAINRLASENGYYLDGENPLKDLSDLKNNLTSSENLLNVVNAESKLTLGMISFIDAMGE